MTFSIVIYCYIQRLLKCCQCIEELESLHKKHFVCFTSLARDGKKVRDKLRKVATKVESEDFDEDLEMVSLSFFFFFDEILR